MNKQEAIRQLETLGTVEELENGRIMLMVPWRDKDNDIEDDDPESYPARVENLVPDALCEHTDWYEEEHQLEITFPRMSFYVFGNAGADDYLIGSCDNLGDAQNLAAKEESKNKTFDSSKGFGEAGFDAFIVRAVNSDHAMVRAARGPFEDLKKVRDSAESAFATGARCRRFRG